MLVHLATAFYGMAVFYAMSWGSFIWSSGFLNLAKDGEDFVCNTVTIGDKSGYSNLAGLF